MRRFIASLSLAACALALPLGLAAAPSVSNVAFVQEPDGAGNTRVRVTYNLATPDGPSTVTLQVSTDGGATFPVLAASVSGDTGGGITTGTKTLYWAVGADMPGQEMNNAAVRLVAEDGLPIPLAVSGTAPQGGAVNVASQTVTFTFGEAVTGFDAGDVATANAAKGAFAAVSPAQYTLAITAQADGAVSVSAPAGAALAASGTGNVSAAGGPYGFEFDSTAPAVDAQVPADGAIIASLPSVVVTLTEAVTGLAAGQLSVNGSVATAVSGTNPYSFSGYAVPGLGAVTVDLASGSAVDAVGNALAAGSWGYMMVDPPVPLAITSTLAEGSVSENQGQTLTFTFGAVVTGFDASDVTVSGATKGAFAGSGAVYTLVLTGTGGTVSASVAADAAVPAAPYPGTAGDSFSNFYQDTWTITLLGLVPMELIRIPAGTFTMGSPSGELSRYSDETWHTVQITQDFYLGKTEVTQQQWLAVRGSWPSTAPTATYGVGNSYPAYNVSYNDIATFMSGLNTAVTEPGTFSLPTESQWEYACRAGMSTRFSFGDGLSTDENCATGGGREANMWYCGNNSGTPPTSTYGTKPVGQKAANPWGLYDMHGNVREWCLDWYGTYPSTPPTAIDPTGPVSGSSRVMRGGCWVNYARDCRSANRGNGGPSGRGPYFGVRVLAVRPVPLAITSTLAEGSVSENQGQTLTFTFGADVTGFDASDVTVSGAVKGAFGGSGAVYTLALTGTGGTVSASVAADAAVSAAPYTGTAGDTFSNFYQDTWTITLPGSVPMELIRIPAGTFTMGSPSGELSHSSEETQHTVQISQDFYLGKTEVTQQQWSAFQPFPQAQAYVGETMPIHNVSWNEITPWLSALNTHVSEPGTFSLPTESQWEYACRAGISTRYVFGDGLSTDDDCARGGGREENMWYCGENSPFGTKLVAQKPANPWGLFDMHGNVWEWCTDWFGTYPETPPTAVDPTGAASGSYRVIRGGGWYSIARYCRSAERYPYPPSDRYDDVGFRLLAVR